VISNKSFKDSQYTKSNNSDNETKESDIEDSAILETWDGKVVIP